jgi:hypothetical protein
MGRKHRVESGIWGVTVGNREDAKILVVAVVVSSVTAGCYDLGSRNRALDIEHLEDPSQKGPALDLPPNETRERVPRLVTAFEDARNGSRVETIDDDVVAWEIVGYLNETAREAGGPAFMENDTIDGRVNWTGDLFEVLWGGSIP